MKFANLSPRRFNQAHRNVAMSHKHVTSERLEMTKQQKHEH